RAFGLPGADRARRPPNQFGETRLAEAEFGAAVADGAAKALTGHCATKPTSVALVGFVLGALFRVPGHRTGLLLDRGELELEGNLLVDRDAALHDGAAPTHAPLLAVDDRGALAPDPARAP